MWGLFDHLFTCSVKKKKKLEFGIWNLEFGIWNLELQIPKMEIQNPNSKDFDLTSYLFTYQLSCTTSSSEFLMSRR